MVYLRVTVEIQTGRPLAGFFDIVNTVVAGLGSPDLRRHPKPRRKDMTTHLRKLMHRIAHRIHGVELTCHLTYFGAVFVEGHGIYAWA